MMMRKYKNTKAKESLIFERASEEIIELCNGQLEVRKGEDPFQALERLIEIRLAYDKLKATLAQKQQSKQEQKKGFKL